MNSKTNSNISRRRFLKGTALTAASAFAVPTISIAHLIVITRMLGRRLKWDPETETFPGSAEANALLDRPRRKGWELPELS